MCIVSKSNLCPSDLEMEAVLQEDKRVFSHRTCSKLLELAATDDLAGFIHEVEEKGYDINESSFWYGRSFGSKKMVFEERTPIMIAALYGSTEVLKYIVKSGRVDVNESCGSDRATPLHCAAAGGSWSSVEIVRLLIDVSANINAVDASGMRPSDLIAPCVKSCGNSMRRKTLEMLLNGVEADEEAMETRQVAFTEKKDYPVVDTPLLDINSGVYMSDEFRMYSFKVKPCSRAYSHDWTECPFAHPGENARRRDPRKCNCTCVPCPDFKKGSCGKGDACEYAHGVFESWLHPAQYRTRLCKDETSCSRKVCFFAHKRDELRPVYASTGSGSSLDMMVSSPLSLGSTPPISPSMACASPGNGMRIPPALQLPGSRLKTALSARDVELDIELLKLQNIRTRQHQQQQQQQMVEEMAGLSSPYVRIGDLKPTNLEDVFGSLDPTLLDMNYLRASYPSSIPPRKPSAYGFDSRLTGFAKRSQSFVDRAGVGYRAVLPGSPNSPGVMGTKISDWGSPDGRLEWGFNGEEANKFRKSLSFSIRSGETAMARSSVDEPDVSWVNSLVRDVPTTGGGGGLYGDGPRRGGVSDMMPHWVDQMYMEQEQMMVA